MKEYNEFLMLMEILLQDILLEMNIVVGSTIFSNKQTDISYVIYNTKFNFESEIDSFYCYDLYNQMNEAINKIDLTKITISNVLFTLKPIKERINYASNLKYSSLLRDYNISNILE